MSQKSTGWLDTAAYSMADQWMEMMHTLCWHRGSADRRHNFFRVKGLRGQALAMPSALFMCLGMRMPATRLKSKS